MPMMPDVFSGKPITTEDGLHVDTVKPPAPPAAPATPEPAAAAPAPASPPVPTAPAPSPEPAPAPPASPTPAAAPQSLPEPVARSKAEGRFDYSSQDPKAYADRLTKEMGRGKASAFIREHGLRLKSAGQYMPEHDPESLEAASDFYQKTHHHLLGLHEPHAEGDAYKPIYPNTVETVGEENYDPKSAAHRMLKNYPDEHLAALASGTHGGKLTKEYRQSGTAALYSSGNGAQGFRVIDPGAQSVWEKVFRKQRDDNPTMLNANFDIADDSPLKGHGKHIFANQVAAARAAGIKEMLTNAAGPGAGAKYNGHYTWPRLGYEGQISPTAFRHLPMPIQAQLDGAGKSRSLRKLFDIPGGKEAWKEMKIGIVPMTFDTNPESANSKALAKYLAEKEVAKETPPK